MGELTHVNPDGQARIVDIGAKAETKRRAVAHGRVRMKADTVQLIRSNRIKKGDVLATARIAGMMAAKETARLVPLCHPLRLEFLEIEFDVASSTHVQVTASVSATERTGVEMEALVAVTTACLTLYDMCKGVDKGMVIENVHVAEKTGGRSGDIKFSPDVMSE